MNRVTANKVRLNTVTMTAGIFIFAVCAAITFFFLQGDKEGLTRGGEAGDNYVMMFAFQYGGGGYFFKVDDDLFGHVVVQ